LHLRQEKWQAIQIFPVAITCPSGQPVSQHLLSINEYLVLEAGHTLLEKKKKPIFPPAAKLS
jgi:hypothetical protein